MVKFSMGGLAGLNPHACRGQGFLGVSEHKRVVFLDSSWIVVNYRLVWGLRVSNCVFSLVYLGGDFQDKVTLHKLCRVW